MLSDRRNIEKFNSYVNYFFPHKILYRCAMIEDGNIVKRDRESSIVAHDADICDLP
jgi:hypothetical protein